MEVKNALYFSLWLFFPKELVVHQQEKVANGREGSSLSVLVCFYCKANLSCCIVLKLKPGLEVPVLSGSSCRAVPGQVGLALKQRAVFSKRTVGASEGLIPRAHQHSSVSSDCKVHITGERDGRSLFMYRAILFVF